MSGLSRLAHWSFGVAAALSAALAFCAPAHASLDRDFGPGGSVLWGPGDPAPKIFGGMSSPGVLADGDATYLVASTVDVDTATRTQTPSLWVARVGADGAADTGFSGDGEASVALPAGYARILAASVTGDRLTVIVLADTEVSVYRFGRDGTVATTVAAKATGGGVFVAAAVRPDGSSVIAYIVADPNGADFGINAIRVDRAGVPAGVTPISQEDSGVRGMVVDGDGNVVLATSTDMGATTAWNLGSNGSPAGALAGARHTGPEFGTLVAADDGRTYWTLDNFTAPGTFEHQSLVRFTGDGLDETWNTVALGQAVSVRANTRAGVLVATATRSAARLQRLDDRGVPDTSWAQDGVLDLPVGTLPAGFEIAEITEPTAAGPGARVAIGVRRGIVLAGLGSARSDGYVRAWRLATGTAADPAGVSDEQPAAPNTAPAPPAPPVLVTGADRTVVTVGATARLPTVRGRLCVSRRHFRVVLRKGRGNRDVAISSVTLRVNGTPVRGLGRERRQGIVDLRGLPKGRFTMRADIGLANGQRVIDERRYRTCVPKDKSRDGTPPKPIVIGERR